MNKKSILLVFLLSVVVLLVSCTTPTIFGKASKAEDVGKARIEAVATTINNNNIKRLDSIGEYSYGIQYSLDQTNALILIELLNKRIESLANQPSIEKIKAMELLVNTLKTNNNILLLKKDKEIEILQQSNIQALKDKEIAIQKYIQLSHDTAATVDTQKSQLDQYQGYFGLGAVYLGFKQFFFSSMYVIIGVLVVLFILRLLSESNPIAAAIFSIFGVIGGYFVKFVKLLIPRAIEYSGNIATSAYTTTKTLLTKIIDNIQSIKDLQTKLGRDITVKELLVELDKSLDTNEKAIIDKIKKDLGY